MSSYPYIGDGPKDSSWPGGKTHALSRRPSIAAAYSSVQTYCILVSASIGLPALVAGLKVHFSMPTREASSRSGWPLDFRTLDCLALPSAPTRNDSVTVPVRWAAMAPSGHTGLEQLLKSTTAGVLLAALSAAVASA